MFVRWVADMKKRHIFDYAKLLIKYNTLKVKYEDLEDTLKSEIYKTFINKLGEPLKMINLEKSNKRLRLKVKTLQEIIKEDKE